MPTPSRLPALALLAVAAAAGFAGYRLLQLERRVAEQQDEAKRALDQVLGELNRLRLEESSGRKGPAGLLEKLRTYAPLLTSSRTTEPDFKNAQKEMDAILRALQSRAEDAKGPLLERLAAVQPGKDFDELKWLLQAAVRVDPAGAKQMLKEALLGTRWPSPRVRYYAAALLNDTDKPLAQVLLRQVLLTESHRGFNPDRAAGQDAPVPDRAALATSGFHQFIGHYLRSEDERIDDTLMMVMTRVEHDVMTVQECVKALGARRYAKASPEIKKLYWQPPGAQENVIFLRHCAGAVAEIDGKGALPFLEEALKKATSEPLAQHLQELANKLR